MVRRPVGRRDGKGFVVKTEEKANRYVSSYQGILSMYWADMLVISGNIHPNTRFPFDINDIPTPQIPQ